MSTLYVTLPGSVVHASGGRYRVERRGEVIADAPIEQIKEILLYSGTQATTQALHDCLRRNAQVHLLTSHGTYLGRLEPSLQHYPDRLRRQVHQTDNAEFTLRLAQRIVEAKITNCKSVIARLAKNRKDSSLTQTVATLQSQAFDATQALSCETLRGVEGAAASSYFAALKQIIPAHWQFNGRQRRPPPDPINAMLSFAYTMALTKVTTALQLEGLHLCMGVLHVTHGTRPALALDLLEEHRAICDRIVLRIVNLNQLQPEDFETDEDGSRLDADARHTFIQAFEQRLNEPVQVADGRTVKWRDSFRHQARLFARALEFGADEYHSIAIR